MTTYITNTPQTTALKSAGITTFKADVEVPASMRVIAVGIIADHNVTSLATGTAYIAAMINHVSATINGKQFSDQDSGCQDTASLHAIQWTSKYANTLLGAFIQDPEATTAGTIIHGFAFPCSVKGGLVSVKVQMNGYSTLVGATGASADTVTLYGFAIAVPETGGDQLGYVVRYASGLSNNQIKTSDNAFIRSIVEGGVSLPNTEISTVLSGFTVGNSKFSPDEVLQLEAITASATTYIGSTTAAGALGVLTVKFEADIWYSAFTENATPGSQVSAAFTASETFMIDALGVLS